MNGREESIQYCDFQLSSLVDCYNGRCSLCLICYSAVFQVLRMDTVLKRVGVGQDKVRDEETGNMDSSQYSNVTAAKSKEFTTSCVFKAIVAVFKVQSAEYSIQYTVHCTV